MLLWLFCTGDLSSEISPSAYRLALKAGHDPSYFSRAIHFPSLGLGWRFGVFAFCFLMMFFMCRGELCEGVSPLAYLWLLVHGLRSCLLASFPCIYGRQNPTASLYVAPATNLVFTRANREVL